MAEYAVVIDFTFTDNVKRQIILDTIDNVRISDSSEITAHPVVSGDTISDHMYRKPISISISGTLSTSSSSTSSLLVSNNKINLITSQEIFTRIKNEAALCDVYKISTVDKNVTFMRRNSLALTNIEWVEKINSVDFNLTFNEVIAADVIEYTQALDDDFLPNISYPDTKSFTETLIDWDKIDSIVWNTGLDTGIITEDFANALPGLGVGALIGLGIGRAIAKTLVALSICSGPVGLIIAGVAAVLGAITVAIISVVKANKYRLKQFKYYKEEQKFEREVSRYGSFVGEIHKNLELLNGALQVYQINYNGEQEAMLTVGNNYYIITFKKNNVSNTYSLEAEDINGTAIDLNTADIKGALVNFGECTSLNALFITEDNYKIYLICPTEDQEKRQDLTNYYILVSSMDPEKFDSAVVEIVRNAVLY